MDDDLIQVYLGNCLGDHMRDELRKSLQIFDSYGIVEVFTDLMGIVARHSATNGEIVQDLFVNRVKEELRGILQAMFISVNEQTSLEKLNELLYVFKLIENLEDYSEIHDLLYSWETNEAIVARLASMFTTVSMESFMDDISHVDGMTMDALKEVVNKKLYNSEEAAEREPQRLQRLRDFVANFAENQVADGFLNASPDLHIPFATYMTAYAQEIVSEDVTATAQNLLFFLLLSEDGHKNPSGCFDENAAMFKFSEDFNEAVRKSIIVQAGQLAEYRRVMNEKERLSSAGH